MSEAMVDKIARALLYEGYMLYPYRPSVKNRQRWTFGGIYPPAWSAAQEGTDACVMQTEVLFETTNAASQIHVRVRFLQLVERTIGKLSQPSMELPPEPKLEIVQSIDIGGRSFQAWQEAVEREIDLSEIDIDALMEHPQTKQFTFPASQMIEPLRAPDAPIVAVLLRRQEALQGTVTISATRAAENVVRVKIRIENQTPLDGTATQNRDAALLRTLVSTHTILQSRAGNFVSLTDPPAALREAVAQCTNIGAWPVLVGAPGERDTMLSSPIIVEDYPKIAPESPGDLFDSAEIDEILTLRIMTLTDDEKRAAAGVDDRVRQLLERTESLARDQLAGLHAALKYVDPLAAASGQPSSRSPLKTASARGIEIKPGDSVRLRPLGRADIMDIALDGKSATVVGIEQDFENRIYISVVVDDDPGKDLGLRGQPGHRFFFGIEEVEPLAPAEAAP
jgi:hypothetical protein